MYDWPITHAVRCVSQSETCDLPLAWQEDSLVSL